MLYKTRHTSSRKLSCRKVVSKPR